MVVVSSDALMVESTCRGKSRAPGELRECEKVKEKVRESERERCLVVNICMVFVVHSNSVFTRMQFESMLKVTTCMYFGVDFSIEL